MNEIVIDMSYQKSALVLQNINNTITRLLTNINSIRYQQNVHNFEDNSDILNKIYASSILVTHFVDYKDFVLLPINGIPSPNTLDYFIGNITHGAQKYYVYIDYSLKPNEIILDSSTSGVRKMKLDCILNDNTPISKIRIIIDNLVF